MSAELQVTRVAAGRALRPRQSAEAVALLSSAFADEPNFVDLFPAPAARARALPAMFTGLLRDAARHGRIDVAWQHAEIAGVAVWFEPWAYPPSPARQVALVPTLLGMVRAEPTAARRLAGFNRSLAALHPPQPYAYLAAVATRPDRQGSGVGRQLLAAGLERADTLQVACYLEAQRESTVGWYARHGFAVQQATRFLPDGATNWTMLRPSRTT